MFSDKKCLWYGHEQEIFVHGHYQCTECSSITNEYCSGETSQNLPTSWKTCKWCDNLVDPEDCFATFKMGSFECDMCKRIISQE